MTKSKIRTLAVPLGLAALAAVLVGIYVTSYRNSVTHGAGLVKVLVAARDIPAGTEGSSVAGGGYLTTQTVPRRAVVPGSVTTAASLTSLVATDPIYKGEQITLRQFKPRAQGGIFAKFSGTQRVVAVMGEPQQLLAGTLSEGDRVDVVATAHYKSGPSRATTKVVLRNLLVLKAPDASKADELGTGAKTSATFVMTRQPGPDDGLGDEDDQLVCRAASDRGPAQQRTEPRDAALGPWPRAPREHGGFADLR